MLASVTIVYLIPDRFLNAGPVQTLENLRLSYIHSWMKGARMVPMQYVTLDYLRYNKLIRACYKV